MGLRTRRAIQAFQRRHKLAVDGQATRSLLEALRQIPDGSQRQTVPNPQKTDASGAQAVYARAKRSFRNGDYVQGVEHLRNAAGQGHEDAQSKINPTARGAAGTVDDGGLIRF